MKEYKNREKSLSNLQFYSRIGWSQGECVLLFNAFYMNGPRDQEDAIYYYQLQGPTKMMMVCNVTLHSSFI